MASDISSKIKRQEGQTVRLPCEIDGVIRPIHPSVWRDNPASYL